MIFVQNLKKSFGDQCILDGVTAQIQQGEIVAILGASGSGKSTFLRCINGLETPCSGEIQADGGVGMVFQNFHLFPHMSVLQNLIYAPVHVKKIRSADATEKAKMLLQQVSLENKIHAYPQTLSGGEKQRVAIARTLMMEPQIVLFDEPTSALDPGMVQEVLKVIKGLAATGMTLLIVTHEMGFVKDVAHRILFLERGKIVEDLSTSDFFNPQVNRRLNSFLNQA